jgi:hypothetical protein
MALDPPLPFESLLGAEAGELELLESEEHAGEAVDCFGVAARVCREHLRVLPDGYREALGSLEALVWFISRREREHGDGHVVGQASLLLSLTSGEGAFPTRTAPMDKQKTYRVRESGREIRNHRQS